MYNNKHTVLGILALLLVFGTALPSEAAKDTTKPDPKAPITVEANKLSFNDATGDIFAQGQVSFVQNDSQVLTELLEGNTKSTRVWINGEATLMQPGTKLVGTHLEYNYNDHTGTMDKTNGKVDKAFVKGDKISVAPQEMVVANGWVTGCPAKEPDYHVEADKIEIWPGDKIIAYNARFYFKDKHIYTLPKYESSLKEGEQGSALPRLGYNSHDGFMISQHVKYPFSKNVSAYTDLTYYTKSGFKPVYGLMDTEKNYTVKLEMGKWANGRHKWIEKKPELSFSLNPQRLGTSSVTASVYAALGQWEGSNISGSRQEYGVYFANDPIKLSEKWQLNLGTGYSTTHYGYNDSRNSIWRVDIGVNGKPSERLDLWSNYAYSNESGTSVYKYDEIENARELTTGFMYKLDAKDGIGINTIYNAEQNILKDVDYTWSRNLHCWQADITYRAKRSEWTMKLSNLHW